jgi:hypothetical protein
MSIISTFLSTGRETGAWPVHWPRESHEPLDKVGVGCGCLCQRADCPADYSWPSVCAPQSGSPSRYLRTGLSIGM